MKKHGLISDFRTPLQLTDGTTTLKNVKGINIPSGAVLGAGSNGIADLTLDSVRMTFEESSGAGPVPIPNGAGSIAELTTITTTDDHEGGIITFSGNITSSGGGDRTLVLEVYFNDVPTGATETFTIKGTTYEQFTIPYSGQISAGDTIELYGYFTNTTGTLTDFNFQDIYALGTVGGGGGGGGHVIQDEGTPLTQRSNLNFVGAGVTATDDSGNDATVVTIPGGGGGASTATDIDISGWNGNIAALVVDVATSKVKTLQRSKMLDIWGALEVDSTIGGQVINFASLVNFVIGELSLTRDNSRFAVSGIGAAAGEIVTEPVGTVTAQDVGAGLNGTSTTLTGEILTRSSVGVYQDIFTMRSTFDSSTSGDRRWGTSANLPFGWAPGDWLTFHLEIPIAE